MPYRVVVFDLFGTLVHFKPQLPGARESTGPASWLEWLREEALAVLPDVPFESLEQQLALVSEEIARERPPEFLEVPSEERFRRALDRVPFSGDAEDAARRLSARHMTYLALQTETPPSHRILLRELQERFALGLVSNFDHGPTAQRVLQHHGLDDFLPVRLISADFGRRKPHPAIFHEALRQLGASPEESLYVGDTPADDIRGAHAAGMDVAWLNRKGRAAPADEPAPTFVLSDLADLREILT